MQRRDVANRYPRPNSGACRDCHASPYRYAGPHSHAYAREGNPDADLYTDAYSNPDTDCYADPNPHADADPRASANTGAIYRLRGEL